MLFHQPHNSQGNYSYNATTYDGISFPLHFHKNFELIYVLSGSVRLTAGEKSADLSPGEFALCLSNEVHSLETLGHSRCWVGVFSEDFVHAFEKQARGMVGSGLAFRCEKSVEDFLVANLIAEAQPPVYLLKACLYAACSEYCRSIRLEPRTEKSSLLMRAIFDYITQNYRSKISLAMMAEALGYNYHYLSKCFHKIFAMSFTAFLNSYRLDMALSMLVETNKDITEIALESGFQSIRNFNEVFKARTGITPAQYRRGRQ